MKPHPPRCTNSDPRATMCEFCGGDLRADGGRVENAALRLIASRGVKPCIRCTGEKEALNCETCRSWWDYGNEEHHSEHCAYVIARDALAQSGHAVDPMMLLRRIVVGWRASGTAEVWDSNALQSAAEYLDRLDRGGCHSQDSIRADAEELANALRDVLAGHPVRNADELIARYSPVPRGREVPPHRSGGSQGLPNPKAKT